jgi:tetratricopeptide (TPR) repeat protein
MSSAALGMLCFQAGLFHHSELAYANSIAEFDTSGRGPDADMAKQLLLLGLACDSQGKHHDAVPIFQRSEGAAADALGPDHPLVGQAFNNRARALIAIKDYTAAEPLFERALALFESTEGEGTNAAVALNGLGMIRNSQARYDEAVPLLERALKIFENEHGPQFLDCGTVWGHLAMAFAHTGDERRGNDALSRARAILGSGR